MFSNIAAFKRKSYPHFPAMILVHPRIHNSNHKADEYHESNACWKCTSADGDISEAKINMIVLRMTHWQLTFEVAKELSH